MLQVEVIFLTRTRRSGGDAQRNHGGFFEPHRGRSLGDENLVNRGVLLKVSSGSVFRKESGVMTED